MNILWKLGPFVCKSLLIFRSSPQGGCPSPGERISSAYKMQSLRMGTVVLAWAGFCLHQKRAGK
jgi:hypothetical protein